MDCGKRYVAWGNRYPSPLVGFQRPSSETGKIGRSLAACVSQLNTRSSALSADELRDPLKAFACLSVQMPLSLGLIWPSGLTAVASTMTRPAQPTARLPRCTRCQSVGMPSMLEYWHMGETKKRFLKVRSRNFKGENMRLMDNLSLR